MTSEPIVAEFDEELTAAERQIVATARQFAESRVRPNAADWQRERTMPVELLRAACREKLAAIELPCEHGGLGLRYSAKLRVVEELAREDFGFAFSLVNHHNALVRVAQCSSRLCQSLVPRMLAGEVLGGFAYTEPEHGSDLGRLETTAVRSEAGWRLRGRKTWTTNAAAADVLLTLAQTDPSAGTRGIGLFLVEADKPGFRRAPALAMAGAHAIGAGGFELEDYFAPDDAVLDEPGPAFRRALEGINGARCYVAAMAAGMLQRAIEIAVGYAKGRQAFGQRLIEFQGLRWSLVDAETDLSALRLLVYRAARRIDRGLEADEASAAAKKFAGERVLGQLANCVQALGANGLCDEHPLVRHLIAAKVASFADGTTEMMNERLGKLLVRRYTQP
jgi:alkylation response protein AidB-like acyl-CoA dehydrogenase